MSEENGRWTAQDANTRITNARIQSLDSEKVSAEFLKALRAGLQDWINAIDEATGSGEITIVECQKCRKEATFDEAIDNGWAPSMITKGGNELLEPTCDECLKNHFTLNDDGEWVENPE